MTDSRIISSNQPGIHDQLEPLVRRHLATRFQRPFAQYNVDVFKQADRLVQQHDGDVILDSYCGVGESTVNLAKKYPQALIIGVDKSSHRLNKHDHHYRTDDITNYHLFQADVDDFWRLALQAGWKLAMHFLLYPNPWPKSAHLKRRIHGSPLFPTVLELGGTIEVRSNWSIYVEEFAAALTMAGHPSSSQSYQPTVAMTPFERKYHQSGQALWQCRCPLDDFLRT